MTNDKRTIVLIHGLWMTPRSWEPFHRYYAERGHPVLAPPWPRLQGEVEDVRRDPSPLNGVGVTEIVDHYERVIRLLDEPPIVMGHSSGGLYVQLLLDRGLAAAGVRSRFSRASLPVSSSIVHDDEPPVFGGSTPEGCPRADARFPSA
jgi:pimeloyl-ACP methyl ester carboxylesterase